MSLWETFRDKPHSSKGQAKKTTRRKEIPASSKTKNHLQRPHKTKTATPFVQQIFDHNGVFEYTVNVQRRRRFRKNSGISIAHKQIRQRSTSEDCYKDGSKVIHRRKEDWSGLQTYTSCIFLDDYERILAADSSGKMDIVRLPDYDNSADYLQENYDTRNQRRSTNRLLGKPHVQELQILPTLDESTTMTALKMKSLSGGSRFVVGMPTGNYYVLDTERQQSKAHCAPASITHYERSLPTALLTTQQSCYPFLKAYCAQGPNRRYYRDRQNKHLSLLSTMMSHQNNNNADNKFHRDTTHNFRQVYGWKSSYPTIHNNNNQYNEKCHRIHSPISFTNNSQHRHSNEALWDFLETPSSLLAAHVDEEYDCFWLHVLDERTDTSNNDKATVVIDKTGRDQSPTRQENISSCTFVSEHCLATSHVLWSSSSTAIAAGAAEYRDGVLQRASTASVTSSVKLWDLRMLRQRHPLSTISIAPSFPHDMSIPMEPISSSYFISSAIDDHSSSTDGDFAITNLHATARCQSSTTGTLFVTTQSPTQTQHHLLDMGRCHVTRTIVQPNPSTSSSSNSNAVYGISASHQAMVCVSDGEPLMVHNLLAEKKNQHEKCRHHSGIKRHLDDEDKNNLEVEDPTCTKVNAILKDRHGLETKLSCLAMNDSGTSILGGTTDGDLFLWRAS